MSDPTSETIAIVGLSCRLPSASNPEQFWCNLRDGVDGLSPLTDAHLLASGVEPADLADPAYVKVAGLVADVAGFDADLFGMTAAQARMCDPQARLFIEAVHAAVEHAGHDITAVSDVTGVFGAAGPNRYAALTGTRVSGAPFADGPDGLADHTSAALDLRGPSVTVATGASSSLVAVHLAVQALAAGECDLAVAGGVHVDLPYGRGYRWTPGDLRAQDGRCRPFDLGASGTVFASGAACVALKRLSDAIADGDWIHAVVLGGAVGHAGGVRHADAGSADVERVAGIVADALLVAGCRADQVGLVEADGTGIAARDRLEVAALAAALRDDPAAAPLPGTVALGSVKANIGHLAWAAGAASLVKVALALDHGQIPPAINLTVPHPGLRLDGTPFSVTGTPRPWPRVAGRPRRAAVHAQGLSGADACLVLAEGSPPAVPPADDRPCIVVWSGRTAAAADAARTRLAAHLPTLDAARFAATTATLQHGRTPHCHRGAVVGGSAAEAVRHLASGVAAVPSKPDRAVTMVLPDAAAFGPAAGAGSAAGAGLYGTQRAFTEAMDECIEACERAGVAVYDTWLGHASQPPTPAQLRATAVAVQVALARAWASWGVTPGGLVGEGSGAIAAAVVAGDLTFDAAVARARDGHRMPARPADAAGGVVVVAGPPGAADALVAEPALVVASLGPDVRGDARHLLEGVARLWTHGVTIDWTALTPPADLQRVPAPGYPYQRRAHWLPGAGSDPTAAAAAPATNLDAAAPPAVAEPSGTAEAADLGLARPAPAPVAAVPPSAAAEPAATGTSDELAALPTPVEPVTPLGRVQHAFWVLEQLSPDSGVSNIGIAFRVAQPLRWWPLHTAVNHLVVRHPSLRLRFPTVDGAPVVHLSSPDDVEITIDSRVTTDDALIGDLQAFLHAPFDLARDVLFRAAHLTLPDGSSVVCMAAHHIVIDAPAVQILVEELGRIYDGVVGEGRVPADLAGVAPMLAEAAPSPDDLQYWADRLRDVDSGTMVLSSARPSPAHPTFAGHTCSVQVAPGARRALEALRDDLRVTDNIILLSAFCLTLLRHGAGPELVVGVPVGRRRPGTHDHVGYGVSTMALRIDADPDAGFRDLVRRTADAFLDGVEHAEATVEAVLTERGHGTADWRVPLFRHMFNYRPWTDDRIRICGQVPEYIEDLFVRSRLDLQCIAVPEPNRFTLRAWHSTEVHDERQIADFLARMQAALEQAAAEPDRPIAELTLRTAADQRAVATVNRTARQWDGPATLLEAVAAHAATTPDAPAVADGGTAVDYAGLAARAVAIRDHLRGAGMGAGDIVALALDRSADMAAAVLGVWAAGAAYLPLDAGHPADRLSFVVGDADARVVVAADATAAAWAGGRPVLTLDGLPPAGPAVGAALVDHPVQAGDLAYVIYTSGSTGRPKGVMVTHGNVANVVRDFADRLALDATSAVAWSTTTAFDISALELLLPLRSGGTVVVARPEVVLRPRAFVDLLRRHDVAVVQATPTVWRLLLDAASDELAGRTLLCGGEPLPAALARRLLATGGAVHNVYGPTETTIWSTVAALRDDPGEHVPIGNPIANTQVRIMDPRGHEVPPGVPGELWIAGAGVAAGYWRRPDLTADRFRHNAELGRCYRTGDRAVLHPDGTLALLGRLDRQRKLRGHRIEPGEVEAVLEEHPDVVAAAVTVEGDPQGDGVLRAVVQARAATADGRRLGQVLGRWALDRLPDYEVPSDVLVVDRLPTTPNGKVDYRALPPMAVADRGAAAERGDATARAPVGGDPGLTAQLVDVWRELLARPGLGAHDNFFLNGGHSLLALQAVTRVEHLVGRPLPVSSVFDHPTPARLAAHLAAGS